MKFFLIFFTALLVGYSGALVPGPLFTLVVAKSAEHGARSGIMIAAGHALLEAALLLGLAVGLTKVLALSWVTALISIFGGAVMLAMGGLMIIKATGGSLGTRSIQSEDPRGDVEPTPYRPDCVSPALSQDTTVRGHRWMRGKAAPSRRTMLYLAGLGALISLSNPFFLLWWATIGSAYFVSAAVYGFIGVMVFFVGHTLADFTWFGFLGHLTAYGSGFLGAKVYRGLVVACGLGLMGIAIYFLVRGITGL